MNKNDLSDLDNEPALKTRAGCVFHPDHNTNITLFIQQSNGAII